MRQSGPPEHMKHWRGIGVPGIGITYSVGFMTYFGHPEVLIHGLNCAMAHLFLSRIADLLAEGARFEDGRTYFGISESRDKCSYPAKFVQVHPDNLTTWTGVAYRSNKSDKSLSVLQMIWSDPKGKFPGDEGFETRFLSRQKIFSEPIPYPE